MISFISLFCTKKLLSYEMLNANCRPTPTSFAPTAASGSNNLSV